MEEPTLKIFLTAFITVFLGTISLWAHVRKTKSIRLSPPFGKSIQKEIRLIDTFYKCLTFIITVIIMVFALLPEYYHLAVPIDWLDNSFVNWIGVLTLATSLVWIVVAQFNIERTIALANAGVEEISFRKLVSYSQKLILTGMLMMFLGFFLTLSSILSTFIFIIGALLFERLQKFESSKSFSIPE
jgi:hypothetical protein